jgi:ribosomal protein S6--L-glutamate ligase
MRIAILGSTDSWYVRDLREAAGGKHEIIPLTFQSLRSHVGAAGPVVGCGEVDLSTVDVVLVRTMTSASLEQVVFRMDTLAQLERLDVPVINPAKAIEVAVDKYLATAKLQAAGLQVPNTWTCQSVDDAMTAFEALGGDVVLKPLFGAEGRGITRLNDEALAWRAFKMLTQMGAVIYLQPFIDHEGFDYRLFVLGDEVLGMQRSNQVDWRTNVSRGAVTEPLEVSADLADMAYRAADAIGAPLAGVDILPGRDGEHYVLEVNAVPGWRALARTLQINVAKRMLSYLCARA